MSAEIIIIFVLLLANGVFAMSEIAIVASRKVRLQQRAEGGDTRAAAALRLARQPTQFLSAVQVGMTLISIFSGAYGGATLTESLAARLNAWPLVAPYSQAIALGIVVTAITYFTLIIGELVPKAIALSNPERIARTVAVPVASVARAAMPVVRLLSASTHLVLALLRVKPETDAHITEEEIRALVRQATDTGEVAPVEQRIVEQVFLLGDRRVQAIMTPRHEIDWIDVNEGVDGVRRHLAATRHPRLVVCDGSVDVVIGVLHAEEMLERTLSGARPDLRTLVKPPLIVPLTMSAFQLLESFRNAHVHVAIVLDEFGATAGLVTPTDILEALVGEIPGGQNQTAGPIIQRNENSWLVDGVASMHDVGQTIPLPVPENEQGLYQTLAGFVMTRLGRVPHEGDQFAWNGYTFEVVDMDGRRVDKVLVERTAPPPAVEAAAS